jgi:FkbH-like protein
MSNVRLSVAGTFTAEPMGPVLEFWLGKLGLAFELEWAPFGQLFQSLVEPSGALRSNKGGVAVIFVRRVDLGRDAGEQEKAASDLRDALEGSVAASGSPHVVLVCPSAPLEDAAAQAADAAFAALLGAVAGVDVVTPVQIAALYPTETLFDAFAEHEGSVPFTDEYYTALATMLARRVRLARSAPKKVVVVDCDDTLWGGVVGEVGTKGVVLDEPRLALQRFLLEQRREGVLVCVVSKNNEADALAVFDERSDMLLRREHLTSWRINWNPKSENILDLARELELGVDSFVFLDDDAFVATEARERAPGLVAVQLPEDPSRIPELLRGLWVFDRGRVTAEDLRRADAYKEKSERDRAKKTLSHAEFLATLALEVTVVPMAEEQVPRVAQLTIRTNQFNATARQRSEAEVRTLASSGLECVVVDVRDRFGEYGLTGAILFGAKAGQLVVDSFLLSCRVLGRGVEHTILRELGRLAEERGLNELVLPFKQTAKNAPYATFFAAVPAARRDDAGEVKTAVLEAKAARAFRYEPTGETEVVDDEGGASKAKAKSAPEPVAASFDDRLVALSLSRVTDIRAALPRKAGGGDVDEATQSDAEKVVSAIVREVMLLSSVGVNDDLFELGADSVAALRILAKVNEQLGIEVPLYELFQLDPPNVAKLSEAIDAKRRANAPVELSPPPVTRTDAIAGSLTSYAQDVILQWEAHRERSATWTFAWRLQVRGKLDVAQLRAALESTLNRQEALRQVWKREGSAWVGRLCAVSDIPLELHDLRGSTDAQVTAFCDELANTGFVVDDRPLARFLLLTRGDEDHVLLALWHQAINDPGAGPLLTEELAETYAALVEKRVPRLGALPVRYVDYARWQRDWATGGGAPIVEEAKKRLEGARPFELGDKPRKAHVLPHVFQKGFRLDVAATDRLQAISRKAGASLFTVFAAAVSGLLASWSGRSDIVFMAPVNLRTQRSAFDNVVGRFINWTTIRLDVSGDPTVDELLERASAAILDAYKYEAVPAPLVYGTNDIFEHPLNRVILNTPIVGGKSYERATGTAGLTLTQEAAEARSGARNDLALVLGTGEGRLFGMIRGAKDVFEEATIAARAQQLCEALERLDGSARLSDLFGAKRKVAIVAPETLARARALVEPWTKRPGFVGAYLFGSLVRPYSDSDSDVDARIVLEDAALGALPVPERRLFVQKDGKKEADIWLMSRSQLASMTLEVDLRALSKAVMLHDERGELATTIDRVSVMSEEVREERLRLHYFEMTFGIQKLNNAIRRDKKSTARLLAAGIVSAAAKLLFVERRVWPASTSWMFEELALEGVEADTITLMQSVLEAGEVRSIRELRAKVDQYLVAKGFAFTTEPERLLEWYTLTAEGERARQRWAGELARVGT